MAWLVSNTVPSALAQGSADPRPTRARPTHPDIVEIADAVAARGFDATLQPEWLAVMNIPNPSRVAVSMKRMTAVEQYPDGSERLRAVMVLTTEKRYVYYMRTFSDRTMGGIGAVVDEAGNVFGGVNLYGDILNGGTIRPLPGDMSLSIARDDTAFWLTRLGLK